MRLEPTNPISTIHAEQGKLVSQTVKPAEISSSSTNPSPKQIFPPKVDQPLEGSSSQDTALQKDAASTGFQVSIPDKYFYDTFESKTKLDSKGSFVILVTGPFGAGKDTLTSKVIEQAGDSFGIEQPVRYTSREMRVNEKNGREYHFLIREEFEKMASADEFLLYGELTDNYYGTSSKSLQNVFDRGKIPLMIQGITEIGPMRKALEDRKIPCLEIFISPIRREELNTPGGIDKALEILEKRMSIAGRNKVQERLELSRAMFKGISEDTVVISNSNGNLENAVLDFLRVVATKKQELNKKPELTEHPAMIEFEETGKVSDDYINSLKIKSNGKFVIIISGPSGVGKGTILKGIVNDESLNIAKVIGSTTRNKRLLEIDGVDYDFMTDERFKEKIKNGELIEWLSVVNGKFYGTSQESIQKVFNLGKHPVLDIDIKGSKFYKHVLERLGIPVLTIFISPVSKDTLKETDGLNKAKEILKSRLENRGSGETKEQINGRVKKADEYLEAVDFFDYIIENTEGNSEKAAQEFKKIIKSKL